MKVIVRWTISNCRKSGLYCLKKSIKNWRRLYPSHELCVCHNNINEATYKYLKRIEDIKLINQNNFAGELKCAPFDTSWKFYPPRIDIDSYEIFVDNDLIVYKHLQELKYFFDNKILIVSSAHKNFYGNFENLLKDKIKINTGFFGIPPAFDLKFHLNNCIDLISQWKNHEDDQGAFCHIMQHFEYIVVSLETLQICNSNVDFAPYALGMCGTHFAGINYGDNRYFKKYINAEIL